MEDLETRSLKFQKIGESLADKDIEVFDTIILNDSIEAT